mgnify:CR=1 FL=1
MTGYLTGSIDSWNNAKRAELESRVTHNVEKEASKECLK